jgi:hypothetical protein
MISAKNYAAQAERGLLEYSKVLRRAGYKGDAFVVSKLSHDVGRAVKFILPTNGVILEDAWKMCEDNDIHLPYRYITLEFDTDGNSEGSETMADNEEIVTKWVIFATEEKGKIPFIACPYIGGRWTCAKLMGGLNIDHHVDAGQGQDDNSFWMNSSVFLREFSRSVPYDDNEKKVLSAMGSIILGFLGMLTCKNVEQSTHQKVSPKNAQRIKSHKLPIYETKILTLKPTVAQVSGIVSGLGSHASKRQHLRRGHIRRLESGNIWVNSCVVGDASKGVINKQYKMAV